MTNPKESRKSVLNADFVNPFLEAATGVFKAMLNAELRRGRVVVKEQTHPSHQVAIVIGITGNVHGQVVINMSEESAIKIAKHLSPQLSAMEVQSEYPDIIGEIANMIVGNAMNLFAANNTSLDMSPPTIITASEMSVKFLRQTTLGINLYSIFGSLEVNIALSQ